MSVVVKSSVGRFVGGALGLVGGAGAGTAASTAAAGLLSGPVAASILGVLAAFAGGAAVYRGIKAAREDQQSDEIHRWLEQIIKQHGSFAKAMAGLPNDLPFDHAQVCDRIRTMQSVFAGDPKGIVTRLEAHPAFAKFIRASTVHLDTELAAHQADLDRLIQMAFDAKALHEDSLDVLNALDGRVVEMQATLQRVEKTQAKQLTKSDLEAMEERMLARLRAAQPAEAPGDESTERDLVAAVERLARDAERGAMTARRVLDSENPGDVADYLAARRAQLELGKEELNKRIDEEAIKLDRELAAVAFTTGRIDEAQAALDRLLTALPNDLEALNGLGQVHRLRGRLSEAEASYRLVLQLSPGGTSWHAIACGNIGLVLRIRGDFAGAEAMHRKSLEISEQLGRQEGMANQYGNLGLLMRARGDFDGAESMFRKSLAIHERLGQLVGMANQYGNLGLLMRVRGHLRRAEVMLRRSLAINERVGRLEGLARDYGNLGLVMQSRGDLDEAEAMVRKSMEINESLGRLEGMARQYGNLGLILRGRDDLDQAEAMFKKGLELNTRLGRLEGMAMQLGNLGIVMQERGDLKGAEAKYRQSLELSERVGRLDGVARQCGNLGTVLAQRGDNKGAREELTRALELFEQLGIDFMAEKTRERLDLLPTESES